MKKLLAAAVILAFFSIIGVCHPSFAWDREPGVYLAQQSQEKSVEEEEYDDEYEDEEYEDAVVEINDPWFRLNYEIFLINDGLYVAILRPMALGYNAVVPVEFRTVAKNFFHNLRFPIRFVNCLLQGKGVKAIEEFSTFFLNTTVGFAGIADVASNYPNLNPSPEDLGQTLAVWGADEGFFIMLPILGPYTFRDLAQFIDSYFLDPVNWLRYSRFGGYSWRTTLAITAYDKFNNLSFQIGDIDALREAALDPYVAVRDAHVAYRNKLIAE